MNEEPYIPFYKPYGMTDEEYNHEVKLAHQKHGEWEQHQPKQLGGVCRLCDSEQIFIMPDGIVKCCGCGFDFNYFKTTNEKI